MNYWSRVVGALSFGLMLTSLEGAYAAPVPNLDSLDTCSVTSSRVSCTGSEHPSELGRIKSIARLPPNDARWLAITDDQVYLCNRSRQRRYASCTLIIEDKNLAHIAVQSREGSVHVSMAQETNDVSSEDAYIFAARLSLRISALALEQTALLHPKENSPLKSPPPELPAAIAIDCSVPGESPSEECENGGNGGGGGGGGGVPRCIPGPLTVCISAPRPITEIYVPDLNDSREITLCGQLGLGCLPPAQPTNPSPAPAIPSVSPAEEARVECDNRYLDQMTYCDAFFKIRGERWWNSCKLEAAEEYSKCLRRANKK